MGMFENTHNCRVCGLFIDELPWGEDGDLPNYDICNCCGVEFGNQDYILESVLRYRENWISKGANWFYPKSKPENWDLDEQMKDAPKYFNDEEL